MTKQPRPGSSRADNRGFVLEFYVALMMFGGKATGGFTGRGASTLAMIEPLLAFALTAVTSLILVAYACVRARAELAGPKPR